MVGGKLLPASWALSTRLLSFPRGLVVAGAGIGVRQLLLSFSYPTSLDLWDSEVSSKVISSRPNPTVLSSVHFFPWSTQLSLLPQYEASDGSGSF